MKLTLQTDYALRALIYLAIHTERLSSIREIAEIYGISEAHMVKIVHRLGMGGFITTIRGRHGGIKLHHASEDISIGDVVRFIEEDLSLLDCMAAQRSSVREGRRVCSLMPSCRLRGVLDEAVGALNAVLNRYSLADVITPFERARLGGATLPRPSSKI